MADPACRPTPERQQGNPDGYAVVIDDPSSRCGYWFAYAYVTQEQAELTNGKAGKKMGRVVPIYFAGAQEGKGAVPADTSPRIGEGPDLLRTAPCSMSSETGARDLLQAASVAIRDLTTGDTEERGWWTAPMRRAFKVKEQIDAAIERMK